jgi:two-component system KDP operon response regulator KdpE
VLQGSNTLRRGRSARRRVLIVEDEPYVRDVIAEYLANAGYVVDAAGSGLQALECMRSTMPDLVLLDLGLPDLDGLEVIRAIRARAATPVIVLSAREAERDKVAALDLGADDYLTKPFGVNELLARVRVALRHAAHAATGTQAVTRFGDLELDLERRTVRSAGADVHLTPTEWDLLKLFTSHPDKVLTDRMITGAIWGASYPAQAHSLHVYVGRLRRKLEAGDGTLRHIVTDPGVGYRFLSEGPPAAKS